MGDLRIEAKFKGLGDAKQFYDRALRAVSPSSFFDSLEKGADVFKVALNQTAPEKTGALKRSIEKKVENYAGGGGATRAWHVAPNIVYAHIQDQGGTVVGKPKLAFHIGGKLIIVHSVTLRGKGYMEKAFKLAVEPATKRVFADITKKLMK